MFFKSPQLRYDRQKYLMENTDCCPPNSWPALITNYQPKGSFFTLESGPKVYHVGSGKRVLVIFSDIFGAFTGRHQSVADTFAQWGYNVYIPEVLPFIYQGPIDQRLGPYIINMDQNKIKTIWHDLRKVIQHEGYKQFFAIGACWGVWKASDLASQQDGFIAIAGFHPSLGIEKMLGRQVKDLVSNLRCPAFFFPAGNDPESDKPGGQNVEILKAKFGEAKTGSIAYPDMIHGFVIRGDLTNDAVKRDVEHALGHARRYFDSFDL